MHRMHKIALITLYFLQTALMLHAAAIEIYRVATADGAAHAPKPIHRIRQWIGKALVMVFDPQAIITGVPRTSIEQLSVLHDHPNDDEHDANHQGAQIKRRKHPTFSVIANLAAAIKTLRRRFVEPPRPVFFHRKICS